MFQKVLDSGSELLIEKKIDNYMKYGDGKLTAVDATIILQKVLSSDFAFSVEVKK